MSGGGAGGRKGPETVQEARRKMLQSMAEATDSMVYAAQRSCGGKGAAAAGPVPRASRKLVRSLKEIVDRPEAEIYAALLDCVMDPDEAVRRLLSQDTLHQEVKMKPDSKKKEVKGTKNVTTRGVPDPGGRNSSVHHSTTDNTTSRSSGSGPGMASTNSTQKQTVPTSPVNQNLVADAPSVPPQTSSVFQHGWSGTPGQLSMADVMEMGRPQAQGKPSTKTVVTADTEVDSVKQVEMSSSMAVTSAMDAPMSSSLGAMGPLLRKLDSLLPPGYRLPKLLKDRIELLKADLEEISGSLLEQSMVDSPNEMAKYWMNEVRELCYDIEDFIDNMMFTHADAKMRPVQSYKVGHVKIASLPKTLKPCTRAAKVAELSTLVREASERHDRYFDGFTSSSSRRVFTGHGRIPALYAEAANNLVGIDDSKAKLIKWLTDDEEKQLKVVAIVGPAGVGKTTLAKQVYHELGEQFECRAFVRASRKPDMRRLLGGILSQVQRHQRPSNFCTVQNLIDNLTKHLQDKRYFIVIDDLWETTPWNIVTSAFPEGNNHSRIMTTTEIEGIALECCDYQSNSNILKMKPLGGEDSGKLLVNLVFGPEHLCPEQFRGASEIIITKCAGLPLAISFVAGLIITQPNNAELWQDVQERICSTLTTDSTLEETLQEILKLSYNSLPHYLKTCLMYLSLYREGYTLWKTDLVEQWIAEGFIHSTEGINTREVADSYFEELVNKGMILPMDINYNGEVFSCTLHHIVLDLIALESTEERFITALDYSQTIGEHYSKARRLSLHFSNTRYATKPTGLALSKVRSICFFGILECVPAIVEFKHLRILILEFWGDLHRSTTFNLTRICRLFQLRYLKITGDASVEVELPIKMRMLRYLETLIIDAAVSAVPLDIVNLPGLLHLSLGDKADLPDEIGRLRSVRTLHYFDLGRNSEDNVLSLGDLMNLQDLHLTYCTDESNEHLKRNLIALASSLGELVNLKSVILAPVASGPAIYHDVWSSMSSLPVFLQRLELLPPICIFSRLPECIRKLQKLCILKVVVSELLMKDMDMLIGLPALTILSLYVRQPTSESIIFKGGAFLGLKYFQYTCGVLSLAFQEEAFPSVQRLELSFNAHKGEQYGHLLSGIEYLLNLKEISGTIGAALGAEEPDRKAAESAFNNAIRNHPRFPSYNHVKRADCVEEEYGPLEKKHFTREKEASTEKPGIREQESVGDIERKTHFSYGQPEIHVDSDSHVISRRHHSMELASVVQKNVLEQMLSNESAEPKALPLSLLKEITCYFSDEKKIGSGGFSTVYKGILDNGTVAVKKLFQRLDMDDKYFLMEVRSLMMLKHKNIVRLLGYCIDTQGEMVKYNGKLVWAEVQERLLCFEYLPNGSLFEQITDASCGLEWRKRYQIISAICEGLYYLHQKNIVHLNLKPDNVLLDDNMMPKIAGFELSRCFNEKQNRDITSKLVGTIGYLAPEQFYNRDNEITFKVDIYSLGVTIMEIVTGMKGYVDVENVLDSWRNRVEKSLAETQLVQVRVCTEIAIECTDFNPAKRPDTKDIITRLGATQSADEATETVDGSSSSVAEVEAKAPVDLQQSTHQIPTERCSEVRESWKVRLEKSQEDICTQLEQVRVCADEGRECTDYNPKMRPDPRTIIDGLVETETIDGSTETSGSSSSVAQHRLLTAHDLEQILLDATAEPRSLPLSLLEQITDYFSHDQEIGSGGFAVVYKGMLGNQIVAVKKLCLQYIHERIFHQEVECLMKAKHKNIIRLLGYCANTRGKMVSYEGRFVMADESQRLLCFEYLPKTLDRYVIDASHGFEWRVHYQIIKGICHGLNYLHQSHIIHLGLKPANIFLDYNLVPKIADFGFSRFFDEKESQIVTSDLMATMKYMPPEFFSRQITLKIDLYSLGVIITEMLMGGKGHFDIDCVLEFWGKRLSNSQRNTQLEQVRVCAEIGLKCIEANPSKRPTTQDILDRLAETGITEGGYKTESSSAVKAEKASR